MPDGDKMIDIEDSNFNINKQYVTSPMEAGRTSGSFNFISKKIETFANCKEPEYKQKEISEMVEHINTFSDIELQSLMSNENEIIRGIASRAFVEKSQNNVLGILKSMLEADNESIRDAAVTSLCYINSPDVLEYLEKAVNDSSVHIKLRALTGIADIAQEYSSEKAKRLLRIFKTDKNKEVREFVSDELSILS